MTVKLKIQVRISIDRTVYLSGNSRIEDVIAHAVQQISHTNQFELHHRGQVLDNQQTLSSAGVQQGDTLELHSAGMTGSPV